MGTFYYISVEGHAFPGLDPVRAKERDNESPGQEPARLVRW